MNASNANRSTSWKTILACLILPVTLSFSSPVDAQIPQDPALQSWMKEEVPRITGDVDPYEGRLVVVEDDIRIPGNGGLDLVIRRVYQHEELGNTNRGLMLDGFDHWEFGLGWKLVFMPRVRQTMFGGVTSPGQLCSTLQSSGALSLLTPDGRQDVLYLNPANTSEAYTRSGWKFACVSGSVLVFAPNGWRYEMGTFARGQIDDGVLATDFYATRVTDLSGNWITTSYQEPFPNSGLAARVPTSVLASDGRALQFTYDTQGRVTQISGPSAAIWTYEYRTLPPSAVLAPFGGKRALSKVTLPNGQTHEYDYYEPGDRQWPNAQNELASMYRIESIKGVHGGVTTYDYVWQEFGQRIYDDEHFEGFPPGAPMPATSYSRVSRKATFDGGVWTYAYAPSLTPGQYDVTTITGPPATAVYKFIGRTFSASTPGNPGLLGVPPECGLMDAKLSRIGMLAEKHIGSDYSETYQWADVGFTWLVDFIHRGRPLGVTWQQAPGACQRGVFLSVLAKRTVAINGAQYATEHLAYDQYGNPTSIRESGPNGGSRTITRTYYHNQALNIRNRVDDETIPGVGSIARAWDSFGRLSSEAVFGVATGYTYTASGDVGSITRPGNKVTSYSQYKRGIPQNEAQPEGITVQRAVNDLGHVTSQTDGEGRTSSYGYDALGRPTLIDLPAGNDAVISYTRTTQTSTRGSLVEVTTVDGFGRRIESSAGGIARIYRYDPVSRLVFESNPGSTTVGKSYQYDALGRVTRVTNADNSYRTFIYGPGNVRVTDERLNVTTYHFRAYGDPSKRHLIRVDAADPAASIVLARGPHDLVDSITQAGLIRGFSYDSRQYLIGETHPEIGTISYGRDAPGNMTSRTIAGVQTIYTYDGQNRLTGITYPDSTPSITRSYWKTGRLKSVDSAGVSRRLGYDANDNLITETLSINGTVLQARYAYNGNDQLSSITYPISGRIVNYAPDVLGRPTQVSGYVTAATYWPSGLVRQINFANGLISNYEYNARLWPSAFSARRDSYQYLSSAYGYDPVGNLTSIVDAVDSDLRRTLGYDNLDRLTTANGPWGNGVINYDGADNITSQLIGAFNLSYAYDAQNRLSGVSGSRASSYSYDGYGNVSNAAGLAYTYDAVPNLRCANCAGGARRDYGYDGLRNRVSVTGAGATTYEFLSWKGELLAEYTPAQSSRLVEYIYLNGQRVAQRVSDQDARTSITPTATTLTVNASGGVVLGANVGGTSPSGTVSFWNQGDLLGTAYVSANQASIEAVGLSAGTHTITAQYSGDTTNSGNSVTYQLTVVVQLPGVPASINVPASSTTGTYSVSWGGANGWVAAYQLYEATNTDFTGQVQAYSGTATSAAFSGRANGTYYYRVRACNPAGCSAYVSGTNATSVAIPPSVPPSISIPTSSTTGGYTISWGSSNGTVTAYELFEAVNGGPFGGTLYSGTATTITLTGKGNGTYSYRVRACNGPACSSYRTGANSITVTLPPSVPGAVVVPAYNNTGNYTVSWGASTGNVTAYELLESVSPNESLIYSGTATSFARSGKPDGVYSYRLRACNGSQCSAYTSAQGMAGVIYVDKIAPTPPTTVGRISPNYTINWSGGSTDSAGAGAGSGVGSWNVYRNGTHIGTSNQPLHSYLDGSPPTNVTLSYVIRSVDRAGNVSGPSPSHSFYIDTIPPTTPGNFRATSVTAGSVSLTWDASTDAFGISWYRIVRTPDGASMGNGNASTSYVDATVSSNTTYTYQIFAVDGHGVKSSPASITVTTPSGAPSVPVMNGSGVVQDTDGRYTISWQASTGPVAYYVLEESSTNTFDPGTVGSYTITPPTVSKQFTRGGGEYNYRVKACTSANVCSGYSAKKLVVICIGGCQ